MLECPLFHLPLNNFNIPQTRSIFSRRKQKRFKSLQENKRIKQLVQKLIAVLENFEAKNCLKSNHDENEKVDSFCKYQEEGSIIELKTNEEDNYHDNNKVPNKQLADPNSIIDGIHAA